ncbi:MAG: asparagine synthase (glutamine-hydrolyzing) [Faecousia sp.]
MCAIAGILDLPWNPELLEKMEKTMERRGPDGKGTFESDQCALVHTRLAIIDPAGGQQPMTLPWAGEVYTLVYNGELYNTEQLRQELIRLGHRFHGHSDTEVVLCSYAQWGENCLEKFNGIFALAVWEEKKKRLFLARDRIGVKPLFYARHGDGLLFASEIKTILTYPTMKARLDREGALQLIMMGPGRLPGSGVFQGIRELEPGCMAVYEKGKLREKRYWKLRDREFTDTLPQTIEKVRFLVEDAIRRQMVSDVPVGTFLSGGLDSSIISAICAAEMAKKGETLQTFSVDYLNNDLYFQAGKFQPNADDAYIRCMQEAIQSCHHWTVLTPEALVAAMEDATLARDLPGMADVDFSLLLFCREIRRSVKVALSGECADEIFGGYPWYRDPEVRSAEGFPWAQNTVQRAGLLLPGIASRPEEFVMDAYRDTCRDSDILPGTSPLEARMKEMMNLNFRWFMQTLLDRKDRMSMYCSLEVRVPFCDWRIAEYLYTVPWMYKDLGGQEKGLLRQAVEDLLPRQVVHRKKSPYPKTHDPRYESLVAGRLEQVLAQKDNALFSLINREAIQSCLDGASSWPWYGQLMRRPQIMAWLLQLEFWLRNYQVDILL